jgi:hypothetical protein
MPAAAGVAAGGRWSGLRVGRARPAVVALAGVDVEGAMPALERIRTDSSVAGEFDELLRIADAGLLRAKADGRDRIVIGTPADAAALVARAA